METNGEIAIIGCRFNTIEFIEQFLADGYDVDFVLTISPSIPNPSEHVSGFANVVPICERHSIPYYRANNYSLDDGADQKILATKQFDLGICVGWQRLLPKWFLETFEHGVYGMHGSYERLPRGRGRAPANWSLIHGASKFHAHVFKYEPGADSGDILGVSTFDINRHDDIQTVQMKGRVVFNRILADNVNEILQGNADLEPQPKDVEATYFPKRTPDDGVVHWDQPVEEVHDFIRAITYPYPGAFGFVDSHKVFIWEGHPFDSRIEYSDSPGTVVERFHSGDIAVATATSPYLVRNYESVTGWEPRIGERFGKHQM